MFRDLLDPRLYGKLSIALNLAQVVCNIYIGNWPKAIYWSACMVLTASVIWGMK